MAPCHFLSPADEVRGRNSDYSINSSAVRAEPRDYRHLLPAHAELTGLPAGLRTTVATMQASRLGLYVHCGHEGRLVRLREIGSVAAIHCMVPAGYRGKVGEIWLARLLPPASALFKYHLVVTTPYILQCGSEAVWLAYLERERQRVGSKSPVRYMDLTSYIMKYGPSVNHWNEYIFCAYAGHCKEAVFLTGIPDIKESLPHA